MMLKGISKLYSALRKRIVPFAGGIIFAILCFISVNYAMKPFSTSEYCGSSCHEMNISYQTWEISSHGTNSYGLSAECIDCHLPPKEEYFTHMTAKAYAGAKDMYMHYFGPEYDRAEIRQEVLSHMKNDTCLHCHKNLTKKPASQKSRIAHMAALNNPDKKEYRCVKCHEYAGHDRQSKLYKP